MEKLQGLSAAVLASDSGLEMRRQCDELTTAMDAFELALMQEWCALATVVSEQKLCQPVLRWGQELTALYLLGSLLPLQCWQRLPAWQPGLQTTLTCPYTA